MILGCRHTSYAGDGHFVDNGLFAYSRRYVLDLGPVDLERTGAQAYRLAKLPNAEFTIGIELVEARPNGLTDARPDHRGRVRVELKTSQGETVILQDAPLEEWVWMHASGDTTSRLYRRGESTEIPLGDGTSRTVAVGEGPSGGWGTYFYSSSSEVYALKIDVLEPLKVTGRPVRLVLVGWGRA
jgi:hypothetical protein